MSESLSNLFFIMLNAALTTLFLFIAGQFFLEFSVGMRPPYMLFGVLSFTVLAVFFFMLSISAGTSPVIPRADLIVIINAAKVIILVAGYIWVMRRGKAHIVIAWREDPPAEGEKHAAND